MVSLKKMRMFVILTLIIILIITSIIASIYIERELNFEEVYQTEFDYDSHRRDMWFTIIDGKPESEFVEDDIESLGIDNSIFDFHKYNYIIAFNHKIKRIVYSYSKANQRNKILIPTSIIGNATLEKNITNYIYVYRFNKIRISSNWHDFSDKYE